MDIKQRLEYRQKPVFTQSLQQSIKILELSLMELKNTVDTELMENPVIEEVSNSVSSSGAPDTALALPRPEKTTQDDENSFSFDKETQPSELDNYEKPLPGKKESLTEALLKQLRINAEDERDLRIGSCIIHRIDENGYLRDNIRAVCAEAECNDEEALKMIRLIQTFDPAGVGAGDLKECLLIQLDKIGDHTELTRNLIQNHLQDLATGDLKKLRKKLKCREEELTGAIKKIQSLEPKPGRSYGSDETAYVIPDITIEERDELLNVSTKDDTIPVIRVNPIYKNMLKSKKVDEGTKNFIRQKIQNAANLMRAIHQRKETLTKVVSIIAQTQREALTEGMEKLKPLTLKEIAQRVNVHESTISRIVMNKYVQTPIGIFALRDFFSSCLTTDDGEDVSAQSIKLKVRELIEHEDKNHPLKDQEIAALILQSEKMPLARRTIAKYRNHLKIPPVAQRRRSI